MDAWLFEAASGMSRAACRGAPLLISKVIVKPIFLTAAAGAAFSVFLSACGGSTPSTSGGVYMGPVANASVAAHEIAADGTVSDKPSAIATTASDGTFRLRGALRYPLLVRVTGGSFEEEADGAAANLSGELDAVYLNAPSQMVVSAYSSAIVADARAAGGLVAGNIAAAMSRVNAFAGDIDVQQTTPAFAAAGTASTVTDGAKMALALGAESESRTADGGSIGESTQDIVAQAANGDTLTSCHAGAGNIAADGTLGAPAGGNCSITAGASAYVSNPRNRSGITAAAQIEPAMPGAIQTAKGSALACGDRVALLNDNLALFDGRRNDVQARLTGNMTKANWATFVTTSSWGPLAGQYGAIQPPAGCADIDTFRRELVMAVENYWVDQNINYCHHHVPGWLPMDDSSSADPKYRNSSKGSTSGEKGNSTQQYGMTCTAQRNGIDGSQIVQHQGEARAQALPPAQIQWHGVDCSDFTAWVYNFAGLTTDNREVETGITTQACMTPAGAASTPKWAGPQQAGVLLDINHGNFDDTSKHLLPGDLLYITVAPPKVGNVTAPETATSTIALSHVVTWTGKKWSELRNGPDGWRYDPAHIGEPGSRLGGDLAYILNDNDVLRALTALDPYMIVDSHYAGPAYRPFYGWYRGSVSNVRRIIGADAARANPELAALIIEQQPSMARQAAKGTLGQIVLASKHGLANGGYRLAYTQGSNGALASCQRVGIAK
ncbi:putative lipoprotein [Caballeronia cordobensis]|nr:putative lipoprotein [Burkholderia sp. RPE67]